MRFGVRSEIPSGAKKRPSKKRVGSQGSFILLALSLVIFFVLSQDDLDVSGDWELTQELPAGQMVSKATFLQVEETLRVTMKEPRGEEAMGEGTVKGDEIEWSVTRIMPGGEMIITYKGKIEDDAMSGRAQMVDFSRSEWKAIRKRQKDSVKKIKIGRPSLKKNLILSPALV